MYIYVYDIMYISYIHTYFTSLQRSVGPTQGRRERGEEEEESQRSRAKATAQPDRSTGARSRSKKPDQDQEGALAQSCVQAVHDPGS